MTVTARHERVVVASPDRLANHEGCETGRTDTVSTVQPSSATPTPTLPDAIEACLFDLDGVLTDTARAHAAAWKETFDELLREHSAQTGEPFRPFVVPDDYRAHVDGRLRLDGVRTFLASRGIVLPEGSDDDPPDAATVHAVGRRKNERFNHVIQTHGVDVYEGSIRFLESVRARGLRRAVVSASRNCAVVLRAAGIEHLFEVRVDGVVAAERNLRGKPAPDTFLAAAAELGVPPEKAAVFEDAVAGVEAGRAGGFGYVVGVDRIGHADALRAHGADVVVDDLSELLTDEARAMSKKEGA